MINLHDSELKRDWELARDGMPLEKVAPLEQNARMWRMNDIRRARYVRDYVVHLEFDDGLEEGVDLSSYLRKAPIFAPWPNCRTSSNLPWKNTRLAEWSRYRPRAALRNDGKCEPGGRVNALTRAAIAPSLSDLTRITVL